MRKTFVFILSLLIYSAAVAQNDTVSVYFDYNKYNINKAAKRTLDSILRTDIIKKGKQVQLIGYADYLGTDQYNITLSDNRSKAIQSYLLARGVPQQNIVLRIGKGEVKRRVQTDKGYPADRKVDVVIHGTYGGDTTVYFGRKNEETEPDEPLRPFVSVGDKNPDVEKIKTAKPGETVVLSNILFYKGRRKIKEESLPVLKDLLMVMRENPKLKIGVEGHVCCVPLNEDSRDEDGGPYWANLSVGRALAIRNYLLDNGIEESRVTFQGFGHSRPLFHPERNEEQAQKNRRVEIRVLQN